MLLNRTVYFLGKIRLQVEVFNRIDKNFYPNGVWICSAGICGTMKCLWPFHWRFCAYWIDVSWDFQIDCKHNHTDRIWTVFHLYGSFYGLWGLWTFWMLYHNIRIGTVAHRCDISCVLSDRRMTKTIFHILNIWMAFLLSEFECVVANKLDASKNNCIDCNEITFLLYEQIVCDSPTPI